MSYVGGAGAHAAGKDRGMLAQAGCDFIGVPRKLQANLNDNVAAVANDQKLGAEIVSCAGFEKDKQRAAVSHLGTALQQVDAERHQVSVPRERSEPGRTV